MMTGKQLSRPIDIASGALARLSGWLLFSVGLMLGYEVLARRVFSAPTIWASEISELFMVWAVFLSLAWLLHRDDHIKVTVLTDLLAPRLQWVARLFTLVFVLALALLVTLYGARQPYANFLSGRTSGTMLSLPTWWMQASVPVGFALLALQSLVEIVRCTRPASKEPAQP